MRSWRIFCGRSCEFRIVFVTLQVERYRDIVLMLMRHVILRAACVLGKVCKCSAYAAGKMDGLLLCVVGMMCLALPLGAQEVVDEDDMLLELVSQQSKQLHEGDSLYTDGSGLYSYGNDGAYTDEDSAHADYISPLCTPMLFVEEPIHSLNDTAKEEVTIFTLRRDARRYITTHHADLYVGTYDPHLMEETEYEEIEIPRAIVKDLEADKMDIARAIKDRSSHWRKELNTSVQITQNYATNNWYQGEVNAFTMLTNIKGFINYKYKNFVWENSGEWRTGFSTVSSDTLRKINTTDDIFKLNTKVGYQVHKKWYLSLTGEFRTNFWNTWKKNTRTFSSSFLTPIRFTMGIGVDYQPVSGVTINLSPATYKMVYALRYDPDVVDVTEFGIASGENMLSEIGSSVRLDWKWKPLREIEMETKFYFYTNYKRIETELEVDFNFIINRYLSAKVMLYPRYDSSTEIKEGRKSKIQFKELISVGFSHTFR